MITTYFSAIQTKITEKAASGIYKGVTTVELDNLAAEVAASMTTVHPDYAILAARIAISNLHKETKKVLWVVGARWWVDTGQTGIPEGGFLQRDSTKLLYHSNSVFSASPTWSPTSTSTSTRRMGAVCR